MLLEIRESNELTLSGLAELLNKNYNLKITKSMISRWENDKAVPNLIFIQAYAKEFNIDLNYLLGLSNKKSELKQKNVEFDLGSLKLNKIARYAKDLEETDQDVVLNVLEAMKKAKLKTDGNEDEDADKI